MKTRHFPLVLIVAGLGLAALAVSADAQTDHPHASAAKHQSKKRVVGVLPGGGQIACTSLGCGQIPGNCHPTPGMRWNGDPSGYDVVICR